MVFSFIYEKTYIIIILVLLEVVENIKIFEYILQQK